MYIVSIHSHLKLQSMQIEFNKWKKKKKEEEILPFCRAFRAVVFPLNVFPSKHPLIANEGNSGTVDLTWGGWDFSTNLWITWPNMLLLEGGILSTISSGKAHSPIMFCKITIKQKKKRIFLKVEFRHKNF